MKKISIIIVCFALFLAGCTSAPPTNYFLSNLPWTPYGTFVEGSIGEEICEYTYVRYKGRADVDQPVIITTDKSKVTYKLQEGYSFNYQNEQIEVIKDENSTLLTVTTYIEYKEEDYVDGFYFGEEENCVSYAAFHRYNLTAIKTYSNAQSLEGAHTIYIDYAQKTATLNDETGKNTLKIKKGGYDNYSVNYLFRALDNLKPEGIQTLDVILAYDDFKFERNSIKALKLTQSTALDLININVSPSVYALFYDQADENLEIPCLDTTLVLDQQKSGPKIKLYYSSLETRIDSTQSGLTYRAKNILIKSEQTSYGYLSGALDIDYTHVLTLSNYTNK